MKKFKTIARIVPIMAFLGIHAFADESFGGIGVTIVPSKEGVRIIDVIPGSPAADAGLEANDRIFAVDGTKLSPSDFEGAKESLRGTVGKPLEVSVIRESDSLSFTLRRSALRLKEVSDEALKNWYGSGTESYSKAEVQVVAEQGASSNEKLLAVLDNGRTVSEVSNGKNVTAIFVESEVTFDSPVISKKTVASALAKLKGFSRTTISFDAENAGNVRVIVTDANGQVFENKIVAARVGANFIGWNGETVPSGRYTVTLEQEGKTSAAVAKLK